MRHWLLNIQVLTLHGHVPGHPASAWLPKSARPHREKPHVAVDVSRQCWHWVDRIPRHDPSLVRVWTLLCKSAICLLLNGQAGKGPGSCIIQYIDIFLYVKSLHASSMACVSRVSLPKKLNVLPEFNFVSFQNHFA